MGEDGDAVEGAVVLGVVQPALEAVGAVAADADAHNVRGAAGENDGRLQSRLNCIWSSHVHSCSFSHACLRLVGAWHCALCDCKFCWLCKEVEETGEPHCQLRMKIGIENNRTCQQVMDILTINAEQNDFSQKEFLSLDRYPLSIPSIPTNAPKSELPLL